MLPPIKVKPRLNLQIFNDTSNGFGNDHLCATADIKLRSMFDVTCMNKKRIMKKKQWAVMEHPKYPDVQARVEMSLELTTWDQGKQKKVVHWEELRGNRWKTRMLCSCDAIPASYVFALQRCSVLQLSDSRYSQEFSVTTFYRLADIPLHSHVYPVYIHDHPVKEILRGRCVLTNYSYLPAFG